MPKYLVKASYTPQGLKGVLAEGGTSRRDAVEKLAADLGAQMEMFYFAFGDDDVYLVLDAPDNATMAGVSMAVTAAGAAATSVTVLLSPEEVDSAAKIPVAYRAPGH
jgi:uncharacterized protein with GYD domain